MYPIEFAVIILPVFNHFCSILNSEAVCAVYPLKAKSPSFVEKLLERATEYKALEKEIAIATLTPATVAPL